MTDWPTAPPAFPPAPPSTPPRWGGVAGPPRAGVPTYPAGPSSSPPAPIPPSPGGPSGRRRALIAVVVGLATVLLVGIALFAVTRPADTSDAAARATTTTRAPSSSTTTPPGSTAPSTTTPSTPAPSTTLPTGPAPTQAELEATVEELSRFVEQERGLTFLEPVQVELLDDAEFESRLLDTVDEEEADVESDAALLAALGLIPAGTDLTAVTRQLLSAGVLGYYDPETNELVVRGAALTPYVKETIVHELTHALDDQHFELDRPQYDDRPDEIGFGFSAIVEGNATRVEQAWTAGLSPADAAERDREETQFGLGADLTGVPPALIDLLVAPYELGEPLVDDVLSTGGQPALDAAFGDPPTTSEQVLHPEAYEAREPALEVEHPTADGEVVDEGVLGELVLKEALTEAVGPVVATEAAAGWGGDWYVLWEDEERGSCLRFNVSADSPADLEELGDALDDWSWAQPDATVDQLDADTLQVTSCVSASGGGVSPL